MEKQILHVDVNNAFLSWTATDQLKNGASIDIRTIPAIIGGEESQRRGVVLAKSMIAKQFGVTTGEPIYFARKKCPNLSVFPSNFAIYTQYSNALYTLLLDYTDRIERFSIDECFLDMTTYIPKGKTLLEIASEISKRVKEELKFTVNIGVAHNKLLAKMASDFQKPDKIHTLFEDELPSKLWTLPASDLFMVGKKTLPKLEKIQIKTIGDLAKSDEAILIRTFGKHGKMMWEYANGIDPSEVEYKKSNPKGIGNSVTLGQDISSIERLNEILLALAEQVAYRLRKHQLLAGVVNVQIKTSDFKVFSHQKKLDIETNSTKQIYEIAKTLLKELHRAREIRLLGLRVDGLIHPEEKQMTFFDYEKNTKQEKLDKAIDMLKEKYGYNSITRAGKMEVKDILQIKEEK